MAARMKDSSEFETWPSGWFEKVNFPKNKLELTANSFSFSIQY